MVESNDWRAMKTAIYFSASQVLGSTSRKLQNWFDENDIKIKTIGGETSVYRAHENYLDSDAKKNFYINKRINFQKKTLNFAKRSALLKN